MTEKKRILIVNKFYYPRGGDCVVALNTERLLRQAGHEVAVFAMRYPDNIDSAWSQYFAANTNFATGSKLAALKRIMGWGDIRDSFGRLLRDFRPHVVHLHNIHSYLSPVVAEMAHKHGCRVVWTLHDYKLLCPSYACKRQGKPCELCFGHKHHVLQHRCMKGSLAASGVAWLEALWWSRKRLERCTHAFVCPSQFMARKMAQGGFDPAKLATVCNFVDPVKLEQFQRMQRGQQAGGYYCYVGRLSEEKGVATLLAAAQQAGLPLRVAGDGPLGQQLRQQYGSVPHIQFLGQQSAQQVSDLLGNARFSVMPSECYENNPLSVIESLCAGTPVVGANIGGIPELIAQGHSGFTFDSGSTSQLAAAIAQAWQQPWDNQAIKQQALQQFSAQHHLQLLQQLYFGSGK